MDLQSLFDVLQGGDSNAPEAPPPPLMPSTPATLPSGQGPDLMALLSWLKDHLIQSGAPGDTSPRQYDQSLAQTGSVRQAPDPLAPPAGMTPDLLAQVAGRTPTNYQPGNPGGAPDDAMQQALTAAASSMPGRSDAPPGIDPVQWLRETEQVKRDLDAHRQTQNAPPVPVKPPTIGMPDAQKPGFDWRSLIEMAGPIIGGLTIGDPAGRNGFMNGYMHGQQTAKQEQEQRSKEAEKKAQAASDYLLKIGEHAQNITDPTEFEHYVKLAEAAGVKSGYLQPGELRDQVTLSPTKVAEAKRKEIGDQLDALEKGGYNLDELASAGSSITLKDGSKVSVGTALDLTRKRPTLPGGVNVPKPKPDKRGLQTKTIMVDGVRTEANFDPDTGKYSDPVSGKVFTGKLSPAEPVVSPETQAMKELQIELARQRLKEGNAKAEGLSEDGSDYAATQYRITGKMPSLGNGGQAIKTAIINKAAAQAKLLGQSPAASVQKQAAYKADGAALSKMTTMSASAEAFETKALQQAEIVSDLSQKVSRTNYPIINDALLTGKARILGDQDTQLLYNALTTFTTEYAKIMEGSTGSAGGSTESARATAAKLISAGLNKGTLQATLDLMKREMALTIDGYRATIDHITSNMGGIVPPPSPTTGKPPVGVSYQDYLRSRRGN